MATECTGYRHTQPLLIHPHCRHCFLHLPLCIAGGFGVRRKGPYGLNQNIFFSLRKNQNSSDSEQKARKQWKMLLSQGAKSFRMAVRREMLVTPSRPLHVYFLVSFYMLSLSWLHKSCLALPCPALPNPNPPRLETAPGRVNSVQLCGWKWKSKD